MFYEIVHSVLDAGLVVGVLFVWRDLRRAKTELRELFLTPRPRREARVEAVKEFAIFKGDVFLGVRPEGHPDIGQVRAWPDGRVEER